MRYLLRGSYLDLRSKANAELEVPHGLLVLLPVLHKTPVWTQFHKCWGEEREEG